MSQAHPRLSRVLIERIDWAECIERYDREHTLFYLDPPYWGTEGYGAPFDLTQYDRMAELLKRIKGKAIVSVNDIPEMRRAFAGLKTRRAKISYSVGAAGRGREPRGELIVRNW